MSNGAPFGYDYVNAYNSMAKPSTMHASNTGLSRFFQRYLLQKAMSPFEFTLPEYWEDNYFLYTLYVEGHVAVINTDVYGPICQACQLGGYNVFYQPSFVTIANPLIISTANPIIGTNCTVIKLQPDYGGIYDLVSFYADLMALCAQAGGVNIFNSHLSYILTASNKAAADSLKRVVDKVASGEAAVAVDKELFTSTGAVPWQSFSNDLRNNFIAPELFALLRQIEQMFEKDVGLPTANTEKKERLLVDEVAANNFSTVSKCELWFQEVEKGCKQTRDMFGIDISVKWRKGARDNDINGDGASQVGPNYIRQLNASNGGRKADGN